MNAASAALAKIKALPLPDLKLSGGRNPFETLVFQEETKDKKLETKQSRVNPFHTAMVVRNPLTLNEARSKWDPFWKTLNADEEYSLLKNPKKYTLLVKQYQGGSILQQNGSTDTKTGAAKSKSTWSIFGSSERGEGEMLNAAAAQAHELARFLREPRFGFQAYVLHMRENSCVFIGGFDDLNDPEARRLQQQIGQIKFNTQNGKDPIGLITMPPPFEVPRF
jgi:hypothetical protein